MNQRIGIGVGILILVVAGAILVLPIGPGPPEDAQSNYLDDSVSLETIFDSSGVTGAFTARGVAICDEGQVTRLDSTRAPTSQTYADEYRCRDGQGTFVLRGELPIDQETAGSRSVVEGTWSIEGGTGDFGEFKGSGTSSVNLDGDRTESYRGTLING